MEPDAEKRVRVLFLSVIKCHYVAAQMCSVKTQKKMGPARETSPREALRGDEKCYTDPFLNVSSSIVQ